MIGPNQFTAKGTSVTVWSIETFWKISFSFMYNFIWDLFGKLHGWGWKFYILWWLPGNCKWIPISCFFLLQRLKPHNPWTFLPKHISSFKFQKSSALHRILYFTEICKSLNPPSFYTFLFCLIAQRRGQFPLCVVFMFSHLSQCVQIYHPISSKMRNFWPFPFFLCMLTNVEINAWWHDLFIGKEG